jgi:hypothetical protein
MMMKQKIKYFEHFNLLKYVKGELLRSPAEEMIDLLLFFA